MNKAELISSIAKKTDLSKEASKNALEALLDTVSDELAQKNDVAIVGFGTFSTRERAARTGRNPKTGEEIQIAASVSPVFKAGKSLKDACK